MSIDHGTIAAIYAVIFSQVQVCPECEQDMQSWQSTLRQNAKMTQVFLSIWDIIGGKGFNPKTYAAGTGNEFERPKPVWSCHSERSEESSEGEADSSLRSE